MTDCGAVTANDLFAGEVDDLVEQGPVVGAEFVRGFSGFAVFGEGGFFVEVVADVGAASLDEVPGEVCSSGGGFEVDGGEVGVEETDEVAEPFLFAGVWCGGDEEEVAVGVGGEFAEQVVALGSRAVSDAVCDGARCLKVPGDCRC